MRGEDNCFGVVSEVFDGSPPHARGRQSLTISEMDSFGITPACAGKTRFRGEGYDRLADHPRMRGEDSPMKSSRKLDSGSPPHARGRRENARPFGQWAGITPACAGKTPRPSRRVGERQDHPRMRGEDKNGSRGYRYYAGSPPHARGRRRTSFARPTTSRITPACAGKTVDALLDGFLSRDHPRMRGEDGDWVHADGVLGGSPPHARGRREWGYNISTTRRITPACAGKT